MCRVNKLFFIFFPVDFLCAGGFFFFSYSLCFCGDGEYECGSVISYLVVNDQGISDLTLFLSFFFSE